MGLGVAPRRGGRGRDRTPRSPRPTLMQAKRRRRTAARRPIRVVSSPAASTAASRWSCQSGWSALNSATPSSKQQIGFGLGAVAARSGPGAGRRSPIRGRQGPSPPGRRTRSCSTAQSSPAGAVASRCSATRAELAWASASSRAARRCASDALGRPPSPGRQRRAAGGGQNTSGASSSTPARTEQLGGPGPVEGCHPGQPGRLVQLGPLQNGHRPSQAGRVGTQVHQAQHGPAAQGRGGDDSALGRPRTSPGRCPLHAGPRPACGPETACHPSPPSRPPRRPVPARHPSRPPPAWPPPWRSAGPR